MSDEDLSQKDVATLITDQIAALDDMISEQLSEIMHHDDFQKMEGSWRGLNHLVMKTETSTRLKIRLLPAQRSELQKDLDKAVEFSIKWPRGEMGSLPADAEQFLLIEDALKDIEDIQEELKESRHNATNISRLQKDVDRLIDELEKLKDKVRANGKDY